LILFNNTKHRISKRQVRQPKEIEMTAFQAAFRKQKETAALARQRDRAEMIADMESALERGGAYWESWSREAGCMLRAIDIAVPEQPSAEELRAAINTWG
jgi:hypothetical protein